MKYVHTLSKKHTHDESWQLAITECNCQSNSDCPAPFTCDGCTCKPRKYHLRPLSVCLSVFLVACLSKRHCSSVSCSSVCFISLVCVCFYVCMIESLDLSVFVCFSCFPCGTYQPLLIFFLFFLWRFGLPCYIFFLTLIFSVIYRCVIVNIS